MTDPTVEARRYESVFWVYRQIEGEELSQRAEAFKAYHAAKNHESGTNEE